jgi:hypothetical protein
MTPARSRRIRLLNRPIAIWRLACDDACPEPANPAAQPPDRRLAPGALSPSTARPAATSGSTIR